MGMLTNAALRSERGEVCAWSIRIGIVKHCRREVTLKENRIPTPEKPPSTSDWDGLLQLGGCLMLFVCLAMTVGSVGWTFGLIMYAIFTYSSR